MLDIHEVLVALGPGGTTELAERVLAMLQDRDKACLESVETVLGRLELAGLAEVCAELGKSRQVVGHWIAGRRTPLPGAVVHPFPEPVITLSATPVWDLVAVREWGRAVGILEYVETREEAL
jgi:hypothetical protein